MNWNRFGGALLVAGCVALGIWMGASPTALADVSSQEQYVTETMGGNRSPPVATDFTNTTALNLYLLNGYRIMVCAASGQTLSGTGALRAYFYSERSGVVSRNPSRDLTVNIAAGACSTDGGSTACRCQNFDDIPLATSTNGWVKFVSDGVGVSSGQLTVYYFGYQRNR